MRQGKTKREVVSWLRQILLSLKPEKAHSRNLDCSFVHHLPPPPLLTFPFIYSTLPRIHPLRFGVFIVFKGLKREQQKFQPKCFSSFYHMQAETSSLFRCESIIPNIPLFPAIILQELLRKKSRGRNVFRVH